MKADDKIKLQLINFHLDLLSWLCCPFTYIFFTRKSNYMYVGAKRNKINKCSNVHTWIERYHWAKNELISVIPEIYMYKYVCTEFVQFLNKLIRYCDHKNYLSSFEIQHQYKESLSEKWKAFFVI